MAEPLLVPAVHLLCNAQWLSVRSVDMSFPYHNIKAVNLPVQSFKLIV